MQLFDQVGLTPADLTAILAGARGQADSIRRAAELIDERNMRTKLDAAARKVAEKVSQPLIDASDGVGAALEATDEGVDPRATAIVSAALRHVQEHYEDYDSVLLPMGYRVVDEADPVEVIRISPQDADSLIDKNVPPDPDDPEKTRPKLAGVAIGHFGGFFEQGWRKNDILWGGSTRPSESSRRSCTRGHPTRRGRREPSSSGARSGRSFARSSRGATAG